MRRVHFYHSETGVFHEQSIVASDERFIALNTPPSHTPIEGDYDYLSQRVDVSKGTKDERGVYVVHGPVIDYQPEAPSKDHQWVDRRWIPSPEALAKKQAVTAARARIAEIEQKEIARAVLAHLTSKTDLSALQSLQAELEKLDALVKAG